MQYWTTAHFYNNHAHRMTTPTLINIKVQLPYY